MNETPMLDLNPVDHIIRKLVKAKKSGINLVVVWKPNTVDDVREEDYPNWIGCNFDDAKLAAALFGRGEDEDAGGEE